MARSGADAWLLAGSFDSDPPPGVVSVEGVTVVRYRVPKSHPLNPLRLARHLAAAREALRRHATGIQWNIVHGHMPIGAAAAFSTASTGTRTVYTVHSPAASEQKINWSDGTPLGLLKRIAGVPVVRQLERKGLRRAQLVHVMSRFTLGCLRDEHPGLDLSKVVVIPWWADGVPLSEDRAHLRRHLGWPEERRIAFTLRRLTARMGIEDLVEAAALLPPKANLLTVIGGDGPARTALQARVEQLGIGDRVWFTGRMSEEDVRRAYAAADLFVLPTRMLEGFGLPVIEALSAGCPVIGSTAGAIPEVLADYPQCLYAPGDVPALADLLGRFLDGMLALPTRAELHARIEMTHGRVGIEQQFLRFIWGNDPSETASDSRRMHER